MRFIYSLLIASLLITGSAEARSTVFCAVGDSLVQGGPILNGNPGWPSILAQRRVGQGFAVINAGVGGYTAAQTLALFESELKGHGCTHLGVLACTNDFASGTSAATCLSTLQALIVSAQEDTSGDPNGITVTLLTVPPRGGSSPWDGTKETQRLAFRTSLLALSGVTVVDLEPMAGTGSPVEMATAYRASDKLHFNGTPVTGGTPEVANLVDAAVSW